MAITVDMPKLSDTMEEGVIAKWNVKEGDKVESGDAIAEVETDKATMDVEVFDSGTILKIMAGEGDTVPLGGAIAIIGEEGEDISNLLEKVQAGASSAKSEEKKNEKEPAKEGLAPSTNGEMKQPAGQVESGRIKASPLARKMAEEQGIDLGHVSGSGPGGRIIKKDIEQYAGGAKRPSAQPIPEVSAEDQDYKISQMRKTIARRLAESKFTSPHYYETIDIDMKRAVEARVRLNEVSDVKISFNDIIVKACAVALRRHPQVNSSWLDDKIRQYGSINVAIAVAVDEGLITPVIRNTDHKGLAQIATEARELAEKARNKNLDPEQWQGSTFTVSNLGMFGIEEFTAIINPPNSAILAIGAIRDVPVVENGDIVPGKRMKVTMSSDHRIVDGATAAQFLSTLRNLLENPMEMLL